MALKDPLAASLPGSDSSEPSTASSSQRTVHSSSAAVITAARLDAIPTPALPAAPEPVDDVEIARRLQAKASALREQIRKRIVGQERVIDLLLIALFARGHGLFVGVPGLAKTLLIQTLAEGLGLTFNRIQFTPDLMPSDITGTDVLEEDRTSGRRSFRFIPGPVFANVLLADEINRTPPKTQAALLQAMQETRVTAGGRTFPLPPPFLVFATQNPIEQEGTYPLPEAQLDRFMFLIEVGYPSEQDEVEIVRQTTAQRFVALEPSLSVEDILAFQDLVRRVPVPNHVVEFAVRLARATRPPEGEERDRRAGDERARGKTNAAHQLTWGAGPRASQYLVLGAKARAVLQGRFAASIDDVKDLAVPVLSHRVVVSFQAQSAGVRPADIIRDIVRGLEDGG